MDFAVRRELNENVEYVGAGAGTKKTRSPRSLTNYLKQQAQSPTQPTQSREQLILAAAKQGLALSLGKRGRYPNNDPDTPFNIFEIEHQLLAREQVARC